MRSIRSAADIVALTNEWGFLPFFENGIPGFSVEELTPKELWFASDVDGPWEWKGPVIRASGCAYGKFFGGKAVFISREWFLDFANYRRDGYDFDARYDDELASNRSKKIMDLFDDEKELYSFEIKKNAGFGKSGEKNFDGAITELMMQTYLVMRDFRQKRNKAGEPYGWPVAVYSMPEQLWGYDYVASAYKEDPEVSKERIYKRIRELCPEATEKQIAKLLR